MRISDWSSDVCSSDLLVAGGLVDEDLRFAGIELRRDQGGVQEMHSHGPAFVMHAAEGRKVAVAHGGDRVLVLRELVAQGFEFGRQRRRPALGGDRKSTPLNSSHECASRMQSAVRKKNNDIQYKQKKN